MGALKINSADHWLSLCVREACAWKCQKCGGQYEEGSRGLHNHHYFGRGRWETRYDILDCVAVCYGCHLWCHSNPYDQTEWMKERLGESFDVLIEHARDTMRGKSNKREVKAIADHYKACYQDMLRKRSAGVRGRLEFEGW